MKNKKITWNKTGLWTLLALFLGALVGVGLMSRRIFPIPLFASYTVHFYIAVLLIPALVIFIVCAKQHPEGRRTILIALPVFVSVLVCFYLALLGPLFYLDIHCQTKEQAGLFVRLDCQCEQNASGGTVQTPCAAEQLRPIPFMRLVKER